MERRNETAYKLAKIPTYIYVYIYIYIYMYIYIYSQSAFVYTRQGPWWSLEQCFFIEQVITWNANTFTVKNADQSNTIKMELLNAFVLFKTK